MVFGSGCTYSFSQNAHFYKILFCGTMYSAREDFVYERTKKDFRTYELVGDYYLPCLKAPKSLKIGRFGMIYHNYLRKHKQVTYSGLMLSGKSKEHIEDIDQMKWVGLMNNIRNRVAEIVIKETIYN